MPEPEDDDTTLDIVGWIINPGPRRTAPVGWAGSHWLSSTDFGRYRIEAWPDSCFEIEPRTGSALIQGCPCQVLDERWSMAIGRSTSLRIRRPDGRAETLDVFPSRFVKVAP